MSTNVIENANRILKAIVEKSNTNYQQVMHNNLSSEEFDRSIKSLDSQVQRAGLSEPYGAFAGGTTTARDEAGVSSEEAPAALQLLKDSHRIKQCGRGRGKCLIVLSANPLGGDGSVVPQMPVASDENESTEGVPEMISRDNIPALLRATRDAFRLTDQQLQECQRELRIEQRANEELRAALAESERRLEEKELTSWQ